MTSNFDPLDPIRHIVRFLRGRSATSLEDHERLDRIDERLDQLDILNEHGVAVHDPALRMMVVRQVDVLGEDLSEMLRHHRSGGAEATTP